MFTLLKMTFFLVTITSLNASTNTSSPIEVNKMLENALSNRSYRLPLFNLTVPDDIIKAYTDLCTFLKKNPSAQNISAFTQKNPKLAAFIGVTSFVGIYALLFHGLSIFNKRSKKQCHHEDEYTVVG